MATYTNSKRAYLFWYKCTETARTEYIYIIAVSVKQAMFFFRRHRQQAAYYDYDDNVIEVRPLTINYDVGTILGERSIL